MLRLLGHLVAATWMLAAVSACRRDAAPPADGRTAVWLDISPAIGDPPRDPADALALLQAYGSGTLRVRGVSVTFGNVPIVRGYAAAQELLQRLDSGVLRAWHGASVPEERAAPTEATALLEEALGNESLTIVGTGPATTIASVLLRRPDLASRIERVILIAGTPVDATMSGATGIAADDINVNADPQSMQAVLDSPVSLTLVPAGPATGMGLDTADLDRLDEGRGPIALIMPPARAWLEASTRGDGVTAFAVPAMLAVDVAAHPGALRCEGAVAEIVNAPAGPDLRARPAARLGVAIRTEGRRVAWCHTADAGAKDRMIGDVLRVRPRAP